MGMMGMVSSSKEPEQRHHRLLANGSRRHMGLIVKKQYLRQKYIYQ